MKKSNNKKSKKPLNENKTGLPDNLKSGIANLSGCSMDDVKVHRNSDKPSQLQAHAYAQGTDIHLAQGQEKRLPHEAWHVVQQKQGRVKPTMQMNGKVNINDDAELEKEADVMGAKAISFSNIMQTCITKQKVSQLQLYNSSGAIDSSCSFQIFGPSVDLGSFLLIRSSEWLNKSVSQINIQIFWEQENLPKDFVNYYAGYSEYYAYSNKSFKVNFSMLHHGDWQLLSEKHLNLFEENSLDKTILQSSNFNLKLNNHFFLTGPKNIEDKPSNKNFTKQCDLMMELVAPSEGFGKHLYSKAVALNALSNAKRIANKNCWRILGGKKNLLPSLSLPYVPKAEKIEVTISYS